MKKDRIILGYDHLLERTIADKCKELCKFLNMQVVKTAKALYFELTLERVLKFAADSDQMRKEYTSEMTGGIDKLPLAVQRAAEEQVQKDLYKALSNDWVHRPAPAELVKYLTWSEKSKSEPVTFDTEKIKADCVRYVEPHQIEAYNTLIEACKMMNGATRGQGNEEYFTTDSPVKYEGGVWSVNGDFVELDNLV